jgi:hypothetical protein
MQIRFKIEKGMNFESNMPNMRHPPPPKPPNQMTDSELESPGFNLQIQQEKQYREIKAAIERLEKPHWVIWATFFAGAIAAIASVILLFR